MCSYFNSGVSPATSHQLDHLILIGCDDPGQTAGQQHANQLKNTIKTDKESFNTLLSLEMTTEWPFNDKHFFFISTRTCEKAIPNVTPAMMAMLVSMNAVTNSKQPWNKGGMLVCRGNSDMSYMQIRGKMGVLECIWGSCCSCAWRSQGCWYEVT